MTEENNEYFARFKDTEWCIQDLPVLVVGLGGVGSWLSLFLVKQGYKVQGWDFDNVDVYNVSTQFYSSLDVGNTKSDSLKTNIETVSGGWSENQFIPYYDKFESNIEKVYPITVSCVDSFKGRKSIFDCWLKYYNMMKEDSFEFESRKNIYDYKIDDFLFIDTRMSAEKLWIYAVDPRKPEQIKKYLETIPTDEDAFGEPICTYKGTGHCGAMNATLAVSIINNFVSNSVMKDNLREVPFCIVKDLITFNESIIWE